MRFNVAVVGATGVVGTTLIKLLEERKFPINQLYLLASSRSAGKEICFKDYSVIIENLENFDFSKVDIAFFSAGGEVSKKYAPVAAQANCVVIDNTSCFREDKEIPLIIPEINSSRIRDYAYQNIIANPNCSTIQMLLAVKPIHDLFQVKRINISTYQAVSGAGLKEINQLISDSKEDLIKERLDKPFLSKTNSFNVVPQIDILLDNGYSKEEMKLYNETKKILEDDSVLVNATAVRVPVIYGHSEAIHLETQKPVEISLVIEALKKAPGVELMSEDYPTPREYWGDDKIYIGRLRKDITGQGLNLWTVGDNIRKGAALNALQIAETLIKEYL